MPRPFESNAYPRQWADLVQRSRPKSRFWRQAAQRRYVKCYPKPFVNGAPVAYRPWNRAQSPMRRKTARPAWKPSPSHARYNHHRLGDADFQRIRAHPDDSPARLSSQITCTRLATQINSAQFRRALVALPFRLFGHYSANRLAPLNGITGQAQQWRAGCYATSRASSISRPVSTA